MSTHRQHNDLAPKTFTTANTSFFGPEPTMDPIVFSSLGLLFVGMTTTALIYRFGAHKIAGTAEYALALRWTTAFGLFICTFMGSAPFLLEQGIWILILLFLGIAISLGQIQRAVLAAAPFANPQ